LAHGPAAASCPPSAPTCRPPMVQPLQVEGRRQPLRDQQQLQDQMSLSQGRLLRQQRLEPAVALEELPQQQQQQQQQRRLEPTVGLQELPQQQQLQQQQQWRREPREPLWWRSLEEQLMDWPEDGLDANGGSPMVEMFREFPNESAVVMQRGIELGVVCNVLLVAHCSMLVSDHWATLGSTGALDRWLWFSCLVRLALVAPRPHFWIRTWHLFAEARHQPTPEQVAQRLVDIYAHPFAEERFLLLSYYVWLCLIAAFLCLAPIELTPLANGLQRQCMMSFISIVLHRVLCVSMFFFLRYSQTRHGASSDMLEKCSKTVSWGSALLKLGFGGDDPVRYGDVKVCCICLGCYAPGEQLRVLRCGHYFHRRCVDTWILKHRNCCPLCLLVVGPAGVAG